MAGITISILCFRNNFASGQLCYQKIFCPRNQLASIIIIRRKGANFFAVYIEFGKLDPVYDNVIIGIILFNILCKPNDQFFPFFLWNDTFIIYKKSYGPLILRKYPRSLQDDRNCIKNFSECIFASNPSFLCIE